MLLVVMTMWSLWYWRQRRWWCWCCKWYWWGSGGGGHFYLYTGPVHFLGPFLVVMVVVMALERWRCT